MIFEKKHILSVHILPHCHTGQREKENSFVEHLHAAFYTGTMIAEGTAENSIKFVHSLLGWWL